MSIRKKVIASFHGKTWILGFQTKEDDKVYKAVALNVPMFNDELYPPFIDIARMFDCEAKNIVDAINDYRNSKYWKK